MRIGIEAQRIFRKKKGGMDIVAIEIIKHLQKIDKVNEYIIYSSKGDDDKYSIQETENFKIKFIKGLSYVDWEQIWLPIQVYKDKVDILHCTSNTAPLISTSARIITIHDIMYLEKNTWSKNSNNWYQKLGNYYRKLIVPLVAKSANQIITVSNFEKENITKYLNIPSPKTEVVHNGVSDSFKRMYDKFFLKKIQKKYQVPEKYIFTLGNTEPRKNLRNLLKAYALLNEKINTSPHLVITNIDEEYLNKILEEIKCTNIASKITLTGYVDFSDLPILYSLSEFYVYPSLREGFGLPIIEAMACGTAVITSNVSSMPEIAGDAALLIDPENPDSITEAMMQYLTNTSLKEEKIMKGNLRYKKYTWENAARKQLFIYQEIAVSQLTKKTAISLQ